jgi:hypothetical protein
VSDDPTEQSDQGNGPKPWTIKNIGPEERNAAIKAAKDDKMEIGVWMSRAIRTAIKADRQADRAPVPIESARVRPSDLAPDPSGTGSLDELERLAALARQTAEAQQKPLPRKLAALTYRTITERMVALGGRTAIPLGSDPQTPEADA